VQTPNKVQMIRGKNNRSIEECFWEKVNPEKTERGCIEWIGSKETRGYGMFDGRRFGLKTCRASRIAWMLKYGRDSLPEGIYVCHHCDNPRCVNVDHLFLGTQKDNMRDCFSKGRGYKPTPSNHRRGEGVNTARLNENKVFQLRRMKLKGVPSFRISKWLGWNHRTVALAISGKTWAHVPFPTHEQDELLNHY
jgi:hypothetical protein